MKIRGYVSVLDDLVNGWGAPPLRFPVKTAWYPCRNIVYSKPSLVTTPFSYYSAYLPKDAASIESRTLYSTTRRACGRVEGNFWLLYHLANVRTLTRYTVGPDTGACTQPQPAVRILQ